MREPITNKTQMYGLLAGGLLGNTIAQYFDVATWQASEDYHSSPMWGVRTLTPGGPCRLWCPRDEVAHTVASFAPHACNISMMVDAIATTLLMCDVFMGDYGLEVYGVESPAKGANWREVMPSQGRTYRHLAARGVLARNLTPNDLADLSELLELYPEHVVELSALNRCLGIYPRRRAVIWEVRCMGGVYEEQNWKQSRYQRGWSRDGD